MNFRKCTIEDYDLLARIWEEAGLPFRPRGRDSRESMAREMQARNGSFIIVEVDGRPAGTVLVTHDGRKGWINRVAVLPEFRRKGLGRALVEYAEQRLREQGIGIFACLIEDYNQDSLEVFQKLGYKEFKGMHYLTKRMHPEV